MVQIVVDVLPFAHAPDEHSAFVGRKDDALIAAAVAIHCAAHAVHQYDTVVVRRLTLGGHLL